MFLCRRVIKLELESSVKKSTAEALDWKKKYENEVFVHKENLDTLKKNTAKQVLGLEDIINQLNLKVKTLEQVIKKTYICLRKKEMVHSYFKKVVTYWSFHNKDPKIFKIKNTSVFWSCHKIQ